MQFFIYFNSFKFRFTVLTDVIKVLISRKNYQSIEIDYFWQSSDLAKKFNFVHNFVKKKLIVNKLEDKNYWSCG